MRPANSYQSPSMTPPDEPVIAEDGDGNSVHCHCGRLAIEQDQYDDDLCPDHLQDAYQWDEADKQNDIYKENPDE